MSDAELDFFAALMSDEDLKTHVEGFIADAQKARQPTAVALPLLKFVGTLLIALVAMPKADGRLLVTLFYNGSKNPEAEGFHADICHPKELSVQRIIALIEKGYRTLQAQYPAEAEVSAETIILRQSLYLILQHLGGSLTDPQHSVPSSDSV